MGLGRGAGAGTSMVSTYVTNLEVTVADDAVTVTLAEDPVTVTVGDDTIDLCTGD